LLASVFSGWEELVGAEIARHAQPQSLRDGVLLLVADQPAWATQLRYLAADLLARVRADGTSPDIAEIQIRVATPAPAAPATLPDQRRSVRGRAPFGQAGSFRRSWNPPK
jgi:predicted nucleic acid-binding Zn ribbon protein